MSHPPAAAAAPAGGHDARIVGLIGTGHFLSHFYMLCLAPLFPVWQAEFGVSYATLGLSVALMSATTALLQTPVGFWVDRYGARVFLVGGTLLMALSIAAMAFAPSYWAILGLAILSGVGNSVIHPADYAIMAGSVSKGFMGRAFALHAFTGNLGFAAAPPVIALLLTGMDWRMALLTVGLLGIPVVAAILAQSGVLKDQAKPARKEEGAASGRALLLSRPMLLFFAFFLLSSVAGSGIQSWLVTVLGQLWGTPVLAASTALTAYMAGTTGGNLIGGWIADKSKRNLFVLVTTLTLVAMAVLLLLGLVKLPETALLAVSVVGGLALGISRTPRDVMLKEACPPGEIGKVFGFVSSSLPLGSAIAPVPMGLLIDLGYPGLVLPVVAGLLGLSLLCAGGAKESARAERDAAPLPAE
ncbi:MFS transporter [Siccirubricoccus sp. KC 17139]|uniref:MFS transporter n=1 Tax=Siccirubricoccus soli TaxID=2899147 RepID=A0ABT1DA22_9PROT|nr:MFS transporter [Siccirubricoccus soli]MCO6418777.1 MFS transporter [Siccirubricoccus soli]MCP2684912.1 MFS transporter [Siccirubricoccus soli]